MSDQSHELEPIRKSKAKTAEMAPDPTPDVNPLNRLQRMIGNRALGQLMTPSGQAIMPKMNVTAANDPTEAEADKMAEQVVRKMNRKEDPSASAGGIQRAGEEDEMAMKRIQRESEGEEEEISEKRLQRQAIQRDHGEDEMAMKRIQRESEGEEEEISEKRLQRQAIQRAGDEDEMAMKRIQRESEGEEEEISEKRLQREAIQRDDDDDDVSAKRIQRSADMMGAFSVGGDFESQLDSARGSGGKAMDGDTASKMGGAMGADFSNVRIHDGKESGELNNAIQAKAFTTGSDIFFKQGEYNPGSTDGQKLLAHELTHTIQQGAVNTKRDEKK